VGAGWARGEDDSRERNKTTADAPPPPLLGFLPFFFLLPPFSFLLPVRLGIAVVGEVVGGEALQGPGRRLWVRTEGRERVMQRRRRRALETEMGRSRVFFFGTSDACREGWSCSEVKLQRWPVRRPQKPHHRTRAYTAARFHPRARAAFVAACKQES